MIRIDAIWIATEPMDMRAGTETALARVIVFGAAKPHCAYLFANRRANRMKVLMHDGVGIWLAAWRLNQGKFSTGQAFDKVRKSNSTTSNFTPWCWGCPGNKLARAARSKCFKHLPFDQSVGLC